MNRSIKEWIPTTLLPKLNRQVVHEAESNLGPSISNHGRTISKLTTAPCLPSVEQPYELSHYIDSCRNKFVCAAIKLQQHVLFVAKQFRKVSVVRPGSLKEVRDLSGCPRFCASECLSGYLDVWLDIQIQLCGISHQVNSTYPLQVSGSLYRCSRKNTRSSFSRDRT